MVNGVKVDTFEVDTAPGVMAPAVIVPLTLVRAVGGDAAWPAAEKAMFTRFTLAVARSYRYFGLKVGAAYGNLQVGVVKVNGLSFTGVTSSGVIAATAGDLRIDLGPTKLPAGDYALFVWVDNTVLTTRYASNSIVSSHQSTRELIYIGGVPASGTFSGAWVSTGYLTGVSLAAQ